MYNLPRGIANNNPLNLKISNVPWRNKYIPSKDSTFEQFPTTYDGLHAGATNVINYYRLHGLQTVKTIINQYAPAAENDVAAYVADVCKRLNVGPNDKLNVVDPKTAGQLVTAIIWHENGQCPYHDTEIMTVVDNVLGVKPNTLVA